MFGTALRGVLYSSPFQPLIFPNGETLHCAIIANLVRLQVIPERFRHDDGSYANVLVALSPPPCDGVEVAPD
jgi:hypothetical protein